MTLVIAMVGGLGAVVRFALDAALARRLPGSWSRLMIINLSGSALLGLLTGLTLGGLVSGSIAILLGSGFLGGYTTFSAASLATVELFEQRRWIVSLASSLGMLVGAVTAAALGVAVGLAL